jgi:hypothetical protein
VRVVASVAATVARTVPVLIQVHAVCARGTG